MAVSLTKNFEATVSSSLWWLQSNSKVREKANRANSVPVSAVWPCSLWQPSLKHSPPQCIMHDPNAGFFCCLWPLKGRMVQWFINLVVGESCYRSVTWRARAIRDPGAGMVWNSECCHQHVMWSAEGSERSPRAGKDSSWGIQSLDLSSASVDIPHLEAQQSLVVGGEQDGFCLLDSIAQWNWIEMGRCCDILCWATKMIESLESTRLLSISCSFPAILTKKLRSPSLGCWGLGAVNWMKWDLNGWCSSGKCMCGSGDRQVEIEIKACRGGNTW